MFEVLGLGSLVTLGLGAMLLADVEDVVVVGIVDGTLDRVTS